ncbi:MAG TPA: hypothetical protein VF662_04995 [Allosphingosinicella sp.]|jgi:hypothetical protein
MTGNGVTVAVFGSHTAAEDALKTLERGGIDLRRISIIGRDYHSEEHPLGFFNLGERVRFFGKYGAFWGTLAGILFGSFVLFIPVFGHLVILGPLAATIVSGAQGALVGAGAGAVIGGLTAIGVPRDSAIRYDVQVKADKFLLLVQGDNAEVERARELLAGSEAESVETHESAAAEDELAAPAA